MIAQQVNGVLCVWHPSGAQPTVLYDAPLIRASTVPDGMVMTLMNVEYETLTLRGERHGDDIRFYHICGEGSWLIGSWKPAPVFDARFKIKPFASRGS